MRRLVILVVGAIGLACVGGPSRAADPPPAAKATAEPADDIPLDLEESRVPKPQYDDPKLYARVVELIKGQPLAKAKLDVRVTAIAAGRVSLTAYCREGDLTDRLLHPPEDARRVVAEAFNPAYQAATKLARAVARLPGCKAVEWTEGRYAHVLRVLYAAEKEMDHGKALDYFDEAIRLDPNVARAHNNRGAILATEGRLAEALPEFDRAIALNPNYADPYNNRGASFAKLERSAESIRDCSKAIQLNPKYADAYHNRGLAYLGLAKTNPKWNDKVIADATRAIELRPNYPEAYLNRGNAYSNKKQYRTAIDNYTQALKLRPDYADAYHNRSVAHTFRGEYDDAWSDFHRYQDLGGRPSTAYLKFLKEKSGRSE